MSSLEQDKCYGYITQMSRKRAEARVKEIFSESGIETWLKINRGDTFFRLKTELEPLAERVFFYEFKVESLEKMHARLEREKSYLGEKAGSAKACLKNWEILNSDSWKFSNTARSRTRVTVLLSLLSPITLNLLKTFLAFIPVISIMLMFTSANINDTQTQTQNVLKQVIAIFSIFAGISTIHLLSDSIHNWYLYSNDNDYEQNGENYKSSKSNWIPKFNSLKLFLLLIWLSESFLGLQSIIYFRKNDNSTLQFYEYIEIGLGVSIFALVNIMFSIAKAKRDKKLIGEKKKLLMLLEKKRDIENLVEWIKEEIENGKEMLKETEANYQSLLNQDSGILHQILRLSKASYDGNCQKIILSTDELESISQYISWKENNKIS